MVEKKRESFEVPLTRQEEEEEEEAEKKRHIPPSSTGPQKSSLVVLVIRHTSRTPTSDRTSWLVMFVSQAQVDASCGEHAHWPVSADRRASYRLKA